MTYKFPILVIFLCFFSSVGWCQRVVFSQPGKDAINLAEATIYIDKNEPALIQKTATLFQQDIFMVTGKKPAIVFTATMPARNAIFIGTVASSFMKKLSAEKKINTTALQGKWEAYQVQTIRNPFAGMDQALVITGSDRRGAAFGVFEISSQMGVSPWYWWADVPVKKSDAVYVETATLVSDAPKVKYRGIFINDEAPAFSGWTKEKFGGVNHRVYEKVFELILRLKGNYLWPAMWGNAFNDDDTLNPIKADEWGIVMGTSHHEPMLRAQQEWKRYGKGAWDYSKNDSALRNFWRKGIENMGNHESLVTVGMRGDGDEPMTQGTATALLETVVKDQRQIIAEVTGKPPAETPQVWALYKEVQDYYDKGMRVPDDVTLLIADDNWGNIRKLPRLNAPARKGGYGIYYHFDYVGGPRNYKWINTNPLPRIWEQMHMAYEYNARQVWIVNVGDIKPMEFPISFFLDYAWNPEKIGAGELQKYTTQWAAAQFGNTYAKEIAELLSKYGKYNGRRKPELLDANTYSFNYNEWPNVVQDYNDLLAKAEKINDALPAEYRDAFFELVLHPVKASANLNEMYYNVALNKKAAEKQDIAANKYADKVKELYEKDSLITLEYHNIAGGKWNHMMAQTHIGYTYWQQPPVNKIPALKNVNADVALPAKQEQVTGHRFIKTPASAGKHTFYEAENIGVSMDAAHYTRAINTNGVKWKVLPDLGRTGDAVTIFPVTAPEQKATATSPHLEYDFYTFSKDSFKVNSYFSPSLNYHTTEEGLQYAIAVDNETPQIISINKEDKNSISGIWNKWVGENIIIKTSGHKINQPGKHTLKFWVINPGVILQKLVLDFGGLQPSFLGPPETIAK